MTIENSERIKELETKSIFQEDSIERLSKEVRLQQIEIIKLKDDIDQLMNTIKEPESSSKNDEKPKKTYVKLSFLTKLIVLHRFSYVFHRF